MLENMLYSLQGNCLFGDVDIAAVTFLADAVSKKLFSSHIHLTKKL
jgi:hypothetical protein